MAIKGKITINNVLYMQLDADPTITPTDAPIGSMAVYVSGANYALYLKVASGTDVNTVWRRLDNCWRQGGDSINQDRVIGARTDFAVSLIRNNARIIVLGKRVETGFTSNTIEMFWDATQSTQTGKMLVRDFTGNNGEALNNSIVFQTDHLDIPVSQRLRKSILFLSQGDVGSSVFKRHIVNMYGQNYGEVTPNLNRIENKMSSADKQITSNVSGGYSRIAGTMYEDALELVEIEVTVMLKKHSDGSNISHFKKTCTAKLVNEATRDYQLLFTQDDYTYNQSEAPICTVQLENSTYAGFPTDFDPAYTGNCIVIVILSGLSASTEYDMVCFAKMKGIEDTN